ncbi:MAG: exodeoxyribonuclease VII large subunit [Bacteroidales bacterium]|nr:exodeoxyribonuclease VII large subunit [Bacteroidales bacterium]
MAESSDISLLELQEIIRDGVENAVPEKLWVRAEIASVQAKPNGHCYLELCQSEDGRVVAKARAVIWRGVYALVRAAFREATGSDLAAGMQILARVQASYSELYGLTLVIDDLEPQFTLGAAELEKRKTIELLEKEGYMEMQKRLDFPPLPFSLAVISSRTAAGFGDFCRHLDSNPYGFKFKVELFEAAMQGEDAAASICEAISDATGRFAPANCATLVPTPKIGEFSGAPVIRGGNVVGSSDSETFVGAKPAGGYDAILILRGGGSPLDLVCFDDYTLAVAIATCPIPVLTAIGHDRDYHVADMVAYDYVKTPTALADYFIDAVAAEDEKLSAAASRLRLAASGRIAAEKSKVDRMAAALKSAVAARLAAASSAVDLLESRIHSADPRRVLERGFALVTDSAGRVIRSASQATPGDTLRLVFADGSVAAKVLNDN